MRKKEEKKTGIAHTAMVRRLHFCELRETSRKKLLRHFSYKLYLHSDTHRIHIYIYLTHLPFSKSLHFANYTHIGSSLVIAVIFAKDIY